MADSAVEQILTAIQTKLLTITGIGEVQRMGADALNIERPPAVVIAVENDTPEHLLNEQMNRTLNLSLTLWVKTQDNASKVLEAFKAQVREKMAADPTFNLDIIDSLEGEARGPLTNQDLTEAAEDIAYMVRYRTSRTDPYTLLG